MDKKFSPEQAIIKTMQTEDGLLNAYLCYYEHDIEKAYQRFNNSEEWDAIRNFLAIYKLPNNRVLDLGSGNGIASYAFIKSGFSVVSIEPDDSNLIGYGAMNNFKKLNGFPFCNVSGIGESLPIKHKTFGLVYCRQVLHHSKDLQKMMEEISRVLMPGGIFLATREHVIDDQKTLEIFLANHPLHKYTKAEFAYTITEYLYAIKKSGLKIDKLLLSWDSVINHYPTSNSDLKVKIAIKLKSKFGLKNSFLINSKFIEKLVRNRMSKRDHTPGRLISFVAKLS